MASVTQRPTGKSPVDTLDFVRVTELAALAASRWMGRGERNIADGAAVEAMRDALNDMDIAGRIVIGEGERDEAPMLRSARRGTRARRHRGRHRRRPGRGDQPGSQRPPELDRGHGDCRARRTAARARLVHAEARGRSEGRTVRAHRRTRGRKPRGGRERARTADQRHHRRHFGPPAPCRPHLGGPHGGRADQTGVSDGDVDAAIATAIKGRDAFVWR